MTPTTSMSDLKKHVDSEACILDAISALKSKAQPSIRAAARVFSKPEATLRFRMAGRTSRSHAHETEQILSKAEERTLVRWITRLSVAELRSSLIFSSLKLGTLRRSPQDTVRGFFCVLCIGARLGL